MDFDRGSQKTEKPYAMPMHRCIASAHGGTSQRLKPGRATVRARASSPEVVSAFADIEPPSLFLRCRPGVTRGSPTLDADNRPGVTFLLPLTVAHLKWVSAVWDALLRADPSGTSFPRSVLTSARWQSGHAAACKAVYAGSIPTLAFSGI